MPSESGKKRRFVSKVRTGCTTCKLRHVKCGEERPDCRRCRSAGRMCDGYDVLRSAQACIDSKGTLNLTWIRPTSQPADTTPLEQEAFYVFRMKTIKGLSGIHDPTVWIRHILPISMSEVAVRHAVVALGALGRTSSTDGTPQHNRFALEHYDRALRALRTGAAEEEPIPEETILITCLLFVAFEFRLKCWNQANCHLSGGLTIISEIQDGSRSLESKPRHTVDLLVDVFERLDIQMSLFHSSRVHLNRAIGLAQSTRLPAETKFDSVKSASRALHLNMAAMRELIHRVEKDRFSVEGIVHDNYEQYKNEQTRQIISLSRWDTAMQCLLPFVESSHDQQAAKTLQVQHICTMTMVSLSLSDGREVLWDRFNAEFQRIIDLAASAINEVNKDSHLEEPRLDMGVIPPLYFTALKCRDSRIRHTAIELLRRCTHQEGAWDCETWRLAGAVVELEEQGRVYNDSADLPEASRLYHAFYNLSFSRNIVYCKRRCFEEDGRWLIYQKRVCNE